MEIEVVNNEIVLSAEAKKYLKKMQKLELKKSEIDMEMKALRQQWLEAMEANGIKKFESNIVTVTYIPGTTKKTVDTEKLKEQGLYEAFVKETVTKPSVRMSFKEL